MRFLVFAVVALLASTSHAAEDWEVKRNRDAAKAFLSGPAIDSEPMAINELLGQWQVVDSVQTLVFLYKDDRAAFLRTGVKPHNLYQWARAIPHHFIRHEDPDVRLLALVLATFKREMESYMLGETQGTAYFEARFLVTDGVEHIARSIDKRYTGSSTLDQKVKSTGTWGPVD